jgi:reactive intermediate/imine deaminase
MPLIRRLPTTALACLLFVSSAWADVEVEYLASDRAKSLNLPFSEAVRVGDMLYLSGQLGNLPGTLDLAPGGIEGQTRQVMANIQRILEANGSALDRIVKCTVMMADMAEWPKLNDIYVTYFPGPKPARSAFGAAGLAVGARVEIECWATVGGD